MRDVPPPTSPWVMRQTWSDLLFLHWRVPYAKLRALVPEPLEVDLLDDGTAYIAVVPFRMSGIRMHWMPPVPGTTRTLEMNVRTYVTLGDKPGIYFFSLDAARWLAVEWARTFFMLPYFHARMRVRTAGPAVQQAAP